MFTIGDSYPLGTAKGGDYFTGAAQRDIVVDGEKRRERILATQIAIDFEGQLCLSESTVRHMAQMFGMYDAGQVAPLLRTVEDLVDQNTRLSTELAAAWKEIEELRAGSGFSTVYVGPDGTEHADKKALVQHLLKSRGALPKAPKPMAPKDAPMPKPKKVNA
jgi:hypothetical protein